MKKMTFLISILLMSSVLFIQKISFAQQYSHRATLEGHGDDVESLAFSPDGLILASAGNQDGTIRLWDVATEEQTEIFTGGTDYFWAVAFSPDERTLAAGSDESTIWVWDTLTNETKFILRGHSGDVETVAFSPDGLTLASGSWDNTIRLWDITTGETRAILEGHQGDVKTVVFSPDGLILASGSADDTIRLWDTTTEETQAILEGHGDDVETVAFSPDGLILASGSADDTIQLWDTTTEETQAILEGHSATVEAVVFSPDGLTLASGSWDNTIRLWDITTGETQATLEEHGDDVEALAFSPDGLILASGSADDTIQLWEKLTSVSIKPSHVDFPSIGEELVVSVDITAVERVVGYKVTVQFDDTSLQYISGSHGYYLPAGAITADPMVDGNKVTLSATTLLGHSSGNGTLMTLRFKAITVKTTPLILSDVRIVASDATILQIARMNGYVVQVEDVNIDGIIDVNDLVLVASNYGKTVVPGKYPNPDVNRNGIVNVEDILLITSILDAVPSAPFARAQVSETLNITDVQKWLSHAKQLKFTDATMQRGISVLEQLLETLKQIEAPPTETLLLPNFPNPFNPETWIPYQLAEPAEVTLTIYAANGTMIRTLALGHQPAGMYQSRSRAAYWDGKNALGEPIASGLYFYTLTAGDFTATRRMLILK